MGICAWLCCCCGRNEPDKDTKKPGTDGADSVAAYVNPTNPVTDEPAPSKPLPSSPPHTPADESAPAVNDAKVFVAMWDFNALQDGDLSFHRNERLLVERSEDSDWWYGTSLESNLKGNIPSNFVALEQSEEAEEWYFGDIERPESEKKLNGPGLPPGAFLVRKAASAPGDFCLSVRYNGRVHHYRIRSLGSGSYTINGTADFKTLRELVQHYRSTSDGLVCALTKPCPNAKPQMNSLGKDAWEIDRESLVFQRKLGSGQFGDVWLGLWKNKTEVAIKTLKENTMTPESFLAEAGVMKKMRHKNLVQLYAICSDREPIYIVTEFMKNGSLLDFLRKHSDETLLSANFLIGIMSQVATGMAYMESENFIHRDLAARNILVGDDYICKVADYGLARLIQEECEYYTAQEGTKLPIKWISPESIFYNKFTTKSDVWSFGVLMAEIITKGKVPYPGKKNKDVVAMIERDERMEQPEGCSTSLYDIMLKCWEMEPNKRPTFQELRQCLFNNSDYKDISGFE